MATSSMSCDEVIARERELLTPGCRSDRDRVTQILHDQFREIGASGREWTRAEILDAIQSAPYVGGEAVDFIARDLADGIVLLTYRIVGDRPSLRSSVWLRVDGTWRILFHQGTLADS